MTTVSVLCQTRSSKAAVSTLLRVEDFRAVFEGGDRGDGGGGGDDDDDDDDQGGIFVATADDLEQRVSTDLVDGQVAEFVDMWNST